MLSSIKNKALLFKEQRQFSLSNVFMIGVRTGKGKTTEDLEISPPRTDSWNQFSRNQSIFLKYLGKRGIKETIFRTVCT